MRVLVIYRPVGMTGGDTKTAKELAEGLNTLVGVEAEARPAGDLDGIDSFDVVHLFAACSPDWGLPVSINVRNLGKPLVVTPIWWSREIRQAYFGMPGQDVAPGYTREVQATLQIADLWACHTMSEIQECWRLEPFHDAFVMGKGMKPLEVKPQSSMNYVACVARVERHKNQLNLAEACSMLGYTLKCIGPVRDELYARTIQAWNGEVLGELPYKETLEMMARAQVHALPSFSEVVAGVTMEAAELNVPAVISTIGADAEFFGPGAVYCDPTNLISIIQAVQTAWERPRDRWCPPFESWSKVAGRCVKEYRKLLDE